MLRSEFRQREKALEREAARVFRVSQQVATNERQVRDHSRLVPGWIQVGDEIIGGGRIPDDLDEKVEQEASAVTAARLLTDSNGVSQNRVRLKKRRPPRFRM